MKAGDTFLYPLPNEHLWIVLTNPDANGEVLVVNITTVRSADKDSIDMTVTLNPKDHPFVKDLSYVYYRAAMTKQVSELQAEEKANRLRIKECCSPEVLKLVQMGVGASEHTSKIIVKFYKEHKDL